MPPVHPSITRRPLHRRALDVQVFARDDGLFDVEASLIDTKSLPPEGAEPPRVRPLASREGDADGNPPFQLDRCHALRREGATVAKFYPRWHLATPASTSTVS